MIERGRGMQRRGRTQATMILTLLGLLTSSCSAWASVNLPLHHWTYDAIERLTALAIIDRAMVVPKPYSRKEAARYVAQAIQRVRDDQVPLDGREEIAELLLYRLMRELEPELVDLGVIPEGSHAGRGAIRYGGRAQVEVDSFHLGQGSVRLRENRRGEYYADGTQVQTDLRGWVEITDFVALSAAPKFISNQHALGIGATDNSQNLYMQELNAKLTGGNVTFQVGRGSLWWGPGYHGTLLMSDHHFPLDMLQLGSEEPFQLPWVFRPLGYWKIQSFLTQLERDRDFSRAKVFGLRISYLPISWLELGVTRLTQFDGRGRNQSFPGTVIDTYLDQPNQAGGNEVNEQAMLDFRLRVPQISYLVPFPAGIQLYGEIGSEDKWSQIPLPSRAAVLGGVYIPQMLRGSSTDLRIEYADTDLTRRKTGLADVWYNSGTYVSGVRYRGFPLGHWMGTDAIDLFIRTTHYLTDEFQLGGNFDLSERGRGLPVYEKKLEAGPDLTWWWSRRTQITAGYTYQRIKNPGQITNINPFVETFAGGVTSTNHFLWMNLAVEF